MSLARLDFSFCVFVSAVDKTLLILHAGLVGLLERIDLRFLLVKRWFILVFEGPNDCTRGSCSISENSMTDFLKGCVISRNLVFLSLWLSTALSCNFQSESCGKPEQTEARNPIRLPPLSTLSENATLRHLLATWFVFGVVTKPYQQYYVTRANLGFVPLHTNYQAVCCYMQLWANNANEIHLAFLTCKHQLICDVIPNSQFQLPR